MDILQEEEKEEELQNITTSFLHFSKENKLHNSKATDPDKEMSLSIVILSIVISFYKGNDFQFEINKFEERKNDNDNSKKNKNTLIFAINHDYIKKENENLRYSNKHNFKQECLRKRVEQRNQYNYMQIVLENIQFSLIKFQKNIKNDIEKLCRLTFSLENCEILDFLIESNTKKFLGKYFKEDKINSGDFFCFEFNINKQHKIINKSLEIQFQSKIHPIRIFANGVNLDFFLNFFESFHAKKIDFQEETQNYDFQQQELYIDFFSTHVNNFSTNSKNVKPLKKEANKKKEFDQSDLFVSLFQLEKTLLVIDYDPIFSSLNKVFDDILQIRNIGYIKDLEIYTKSIILKGDSIEEVLENASKILIRHLKDNQTGNFIKKTPYLNNLFNLWGGFSNIFYMPYQSVKEEGNFYKGFSNGIQNFAKVISLEGINASETVANIAGYGLNQIGL